MKDKGHHEEHGEGYTGRQWQSYWNKNTQPLIVIQSQAGLEQNWHSISFMHPMVYIEAADELFLTTPNIHSSTFQFLTLLAKHSCEVVHPVRCRTAHYSNLTGKVPLAVAYSQFLVGAPDFRK